MPTKPGRPPVAAALVLLVILALGLGAAATAAGRPTPPSAARSVRKNTPAQKAAQAFLDVITPLYLPLYRVSSEVAWIASTDVSDEHTGARAAADRAFAAFAGSRVIIERCKALLAKRKDLDEVTARQLDRLLLSASESPGTIPDVVEKRVAAEARQSAILDGYTFCLQKGPGSAGCARPITANGIDDVLQKSRDLGERERVWTASKEIGKPLRPGLVELQKLRNQVAREMGYSSFFALQVADYGMTVPEMMRLLDDALAASKPLYDQLHCWARHEIAARYKKPAPKLIPAHWLTNRWAQHWPGLIEAADLDSLFKGRTPEWIVTSAEDFYVSLGFPRLPESFWKKSDLYPVPPGSARKKNAHASAWHVDLADDVRSLMSVQPNAQWFGTAHHELGHIYYDISYTNPDVPPLARAGANRAFHEGIGELARLASEQTPYLRKMAILPQGKQPDAKLRLLDSALDSIVFLPWSAGTMSHFEHDLYEKELAPADWQKVWWDYVARFQGVAPPGTRSEDGCDACTKTHVNDDPAQYYDYALATLVKFQLHDHICTKILRQDPRSCDYSGSKAVGDFLRGILRVGASRDWRAIMREATGEDIGPRAMIAFYQPLVDDLARRNASRDCTR